MRARLGMAVTGQQILRPGSPDRLDGARVVSHVIRKLPICHDLGCPGTGRLLHSAPLKIRKAALGRPLTGDLSAAGMASILICQPGSGDGKAQRETVRDQGRQAHDRRA